MFALVDCHSFYASCERVFRPDLIGKPIIVLSNNDGCVIARSQEAKDIGIQMGEPFFKRKEFFKKSNVTIFSSNYTLYADMSKRVMNILSTFTPAIEIYSIDEAFLDLSGFEDPEQYGERIRETIVRSTGIPVGVGIGKTKTLAKIANKLSKKTGGVCVLDGDEKTGQSLKNFPVEDIWGIGRQHAKLLNANNIKTALQLKETSESWVVRHLTVVGLRLVRELKGESCLALEQISSRKKGICTSKQFGKPVTDLSELKEAVTNYGSRLSEKLRTEKAACNMVTIFIHTNKHKDTEPAYAASTTIKLPTPSNSVFEIIKYAIIGLESIYKESYRYNKLGLIASGIVPSNEIQTNLFDERDRKREDDLMKTLDKLNERFGKSTVRIAGEGQKAWDMKRAYLSPCYTTSWKDILTIRI